ncbi:MAG: DUF4303 domain-containing protein [Chloroflexota bacterium]|nr:MAG: hypothetical protein DIU68_20465 [Chloroflexota bacterium]
MALQLPFDYDHFSTLLLDAARNAFLRLQRERAGETFYLFALHASEDFANFCIVADTEEALDRLTHAQYQKYRHSWYDGLSFSELRQVLRYGAGEYFCPDAYRPLFDEVNAVASRRSRQLYEAQQQLTSEGGADYAQEALLPYRRAMISVCLRVLKQLEAEGIFGPRERRYEVLVTFLSGMIYHEAYLQYALDLNAPQVVERFLGELVAAADVSQIIQENMWRHAQM